MQRRLSGVVYELIRLLTEGLVTARAAARGWGENRNAAPSLVFKHGWVKVGVLCDITDVRYLAD